MTERRFRIVRDDVIRTGQNRLPWLANLRGVSTPSRVYATIPAQGGRYQARLQKASKARYRNVYEIETLRNQLSTRDTMQRARGRPNRQSRGGRGGGRGGGANEQPSRPSRPRPAYTTVPPIRAIHPGGGVSIVLKEDQQSGHQVKGIVADLLTRGDHPRGVKVRLRDGRVGRVQGLVSEAEGLQGEGIVGGPEANLGRNGEGVNAGGRVRARGGRFEKDIREDDDYLYENRASTQDSGLFAALEEADRKHERNQVGPSTQLLAPEETAVCPVCYKFEGDETSVAHHVEQHFAE